MFNGNPAVSDTGAVVAFDATDLEDGSSRRVWIRDRTAATTTPVAEERSSAPGISGNGCLVAYAVPGGSLAKPTTSLAVLDRCSSLSGQPLPAGTVIDTIAAVDHDSPPALSFDGSTIVWSTGAEIRRYVRPAIDPAAVTPAAIDHVLVGSFDATLIPSVEIVTGAQLDVSDDGTTVVYVAGPGVAPFAPDPGNVYVWSLPEGAITPTIQLLSLTALGAPGDRIIRITDAVGRRISRVLRLVQPRSGRSGYHSRHGPVRRLRRPGRQRDTGPGRRCEPPGGVGRRHARGVRTHRIDSPRLVDVGRDVCHHDGPRRRGPADRDSGHRVGDLPIRTLDRVRQRRRNVPDRRRRVPSRHRCLGRRSATLR